PSPTLAGPASTTGWSTAVRRAAAAGAGEAVPPTYINTYTYTSQRCSGSGALVRTSLSARRCRHVVVGTSLSARRCRCGPTAVPTAGSSWTGTTPRRLRKAGLAQATQQGAGSTWGHQVITEQVSTPQVLSRG